MGANPAPPHPPQPPAAPPPTPPSPSFADAEAHYTHLLAYFKHLVWLTSAALGLIIAAAGILFYSNLRDVRQDAKEQAQRVATDESQKAVKTAFDEKNVTELVEKVAKEKVTAVTDKMVEDKVGPIVEKTVEQRFTSRLQPLEKRMLMIGEISEYQNRMRLGYRSGLDQLYALIGSTTDPDTLRFAKNTLAITAQDYEASFFDPNEGGPVKSPGMTWLEFMKMRGWLPPPKQNTAGVVNVINNDKNLNAVALGFIVFREQTGEKVKMFDLAAVKSWCASHQAQCQ